ncbi:MULTISPECIES: hypothetical protein [unclassified Caballeronia]|uniref:hypothetical protein n=1 Tax=unclassified Caballeronia TaxID=2646786 RepID=UPI002028C4D5|nr:MULTISPECIES: hypothetical protein [unclassified Caballeronia]
MKKIALVCEGATDQRFLEYLLDGFYGGDLVFNSIQPELDATDKDRQGSFGGWENVFSFLERRGVLDEIFATNDFLVIQIDTDVCEHEHFAVSRFVDGAEKPIARLIFDVRATLIARVGVEEFLKYEKRIAFAICVHSLECWLLPLHAINKADFTATLTCEDRLRKALAAQEEKFEKTAAYYRRLAKPMRKKEKRELCCRHNESLRIFVDSLPGISDEIVT